MTALQNSSHRDLIWAMFLSIIGIAAITLLPDLAFAAQGGDGDDKIGNALCRVINFFTGKTGRALATLAIIIVGVGALMGKVSWGMAIIVALGIAVIFGAPQIMEFVGGRASECGQ